MCIEFSYKGPKARRLLLVVLQQGNDQLEEKLPLSDREIGQYTGQYFMEDLIDFFKSNFYSM